jgi:hypothetical protein
MGSPNGGIIGVINPTSFGKCTQTITTATGSTTLTTQPGTRLVLMQLLLEEVEQVETLVEVVEQVDFELVHHFQFVEQHHIQ